MNKGLNLPLSAGELTLDELAAIQNANSPSASNPFVTQDDVPGLIVEPSELVLFPRTRDDNQGTRQAQTDFVGAWYQCPFPGTFNRIIFEVTGNTGAPTGAIGIYQQAEGRSGDADLIISVSGIDTGTNGIKTIATADFSLVQGDCYVLWGRDSAAGNWTARAYSASSVNMLTNNVPTGLRPQLFSTTIAATAFPDPLDPSEGGDVTGSGGNNNALIIRLQNV